MHRSSSSSSTNFNCIQFFFTRRPALFHSLSSSLRSSPRERERVKRLIHQLHSTRQHSGTHFSFDNGAERTRSLFYK